MGLVWMALFNNNLGFLTFHSYRPIFSLCHIFMYGRPHSFYSIFLALHSVLLNRPFVQHTRGNLQFADRRAKQACPRGIRSGPPSTPKSSSLTTPSHRILKATPASRLPRRTPRDPRPDRALWRLAFRIFLLLKPLSNTTIESETQIKMSVWVCFHTIFFFDFSRLHYL